MDLTDRAAVTCDDLAVGVDTICVLCLISDKRDVFGSKIGNAEFDGNSTIHCNFRAGRAGRMLEPDHIVAAVCHPDFAGPIADGSLNGKTVLITAGPTREPIDPVRYIANRSSGRQGHAIAEALGL